MRKLLIAGNWKMNLGLAEAMGLAAGIDEHCVGDMELDVALFPPATYIAKIYETLGDSPIQIGAQNIHTHIDGAFTGEISAKMVLTCGGNMVILGHSERRHIFGEGDDFIASKVNRALSSGLTPVLCIGEKLPDREDGKTEEVLSAQLEGSLEGAQPASPDDLIIAYEPVWAIGTGRNATPNQAQKAHEFIRSRIAGRFGEDFAGKMRILYGGSMKPSNCEELLSRPDVDGGLIGGASLKSESFCEIISAAAKIQREGK